MIQCPRCGIQVNELMPVDSDLAGKMREGGEESPGQVCAGCVSDLKRTYASTTSGGVLMAQERAKEQQRLQLWRSRVGLIKKARLCMTQKMFSEAAVAYEKYLKILEIVFDVKKGSTLTPDLFKESARTTELTVVASTYWDLLRIYDSHEKYADRMQKAAKQLAVFVKFTPIYPDIMKKAEIFAKSAKNPQIIRNFLKDANEQKGACFIATVSFYEGAPEVQALRLWRDQTLMQSPAGQFFIKIYYHISPSIAEIISKSTLLKATSRALLKLLIKCVS
ncbi:MAG: CFI-box-CTERM domain-containing protein [Bdellovibrionia bacterium]